MVFPMVANVTVGTPGMMLALVPSLLPLLDISPLTDPEVLLTYPYVTC